VDIAGLKQQARTLEQQGNLGQALETYRQILSDIDAIGGIRQELPVLIKIGDLYHKTGDIDQAIDMFERAAGEYAAQGAAQPVMSLCVKIVRADPQAVGAYLRLARRLLEAGFTDGAREVLMDYAQRAKLVKTREGLERLAGRADDEVKRVLAKAIDSAEERAPKRTPHPPAAAAPPTPEPAEPEADEPPPEPPKKRLTVPVGAMDLEPSLLEMRPPEPRPEPPPAEVTPASAFPTAEDLQAPVLPEAPAAPPLPPPTPPLAAASPPIEPPPAPVPMDGLLSTLPPPAEPAPPPPSREPRLSVPIMEAMVEPPPPAAQAHAAQDSWAQQEPPRASRPDLRTDPRFSRPSMRAASPPLGASRRARSSRKGVTTLVGFLVLAGGIAALIYFNVIPLDWIKGLLPWGKEQPAETAAPPPAPEPIAVQPDTVMARDTATAQPPVATAPAVPVEEPPAPPPAPRLPPGVSLTRSIMAVGGMRIESVSEIESNGRTGIGLVQVSPTGERVILEEFPTDTVGAAGEIGVTGIPPDTVVGHVRMADLEIQIKGVGILEDRIVQFLQQLVEIRP
jgi:hypothetical protein